MIRPERTLPAVLLALPVLAACHTEVRVRRVAPGDDATPGIRYSLPRPVLRVTPLASGEVDVRVELLPDASRTYAIDARSTLARHRLDVVVERGLLQRVSWRGEPTGAASAAAGMAATYARERIERETAARRDAEREARERRGESEEARRAGERELRRVERTLAVERAELETLRALGAPPSELRPLRARVAGLEAQLAARRREHDDAACVPAPSVGASAAPSLNLPASPVPRTVPGPLLYEVAEERGADGGASVPRLRAVRWPDGSPQGEVEVAVLPPPRRPRPDPPLLRPEGGVHPLLPSRPRIAAARERIEKARAALAELRAGGATPLSVARAMAEAADAEIDLRRAGRLEFRVEASRPLTRLLLDGGRSRLERIDAGAPANSPTLADGVLRDLVHLESATAIRVRLPEELPDGEYSLLLGFEYPGVAGLVEHSGSVDFTVRRIPPEATP